MHRSAIAPTVLLALALAACATGPAPGPDASAAERGAALSDDADAALEAGDLERAHRLLVRAVALAPDDVDAWWRLSVVETRRGDYDAAASALARIARGWPDLLGNVDGAYIGQVAMLATPDGRERLDLLQALFDAGWDDNGLGADELWLDLATLRVERGEAAHAAAVVAGIADPLAIVRLRMDKRFDSLVDRNDERFDVALAMQRKLARLARLSARHPRWLEARNRLGFALLEAGQHAAALADTEAVLASIAAAPPDAPAFDDMDALNWTGDIRAVALRRLGRMQEAVQVMRDASAAAESGAPNVSQSLNLGAFLCALERWDEAQAAIDGLTGMTPYGQMVQGAVRHCIALGRGDAAAAATSLAYIRGHRDDSPAIHLEVLVEAGRIDEAAAIVVGMLAAPVERSEALFQFQAFREPVPLPGSAALERGWNALQDRPEVRAAVERVGRIERHPIHRDNGIL